MTPGIHLAHKPVGPTSFSIVKGLLDATPRSTGGRRAPRLCHGGTLDPFASGLLLILVEPATKLFDYLHDVPKVYEATVRWGIETDNGDPLGRIVSEGDASGLTAERLDEALTAFTGWHEQVPHTTSAKRIGGERAYEKAHRGEDVVMPPARVYLHEARWLAHDLPRESRLRVAVRGGYYIRALARDLGRLLGCSAHLSQLHRASIGPWNDPGTGQLVTLHGRDIMPWLPCRLLGDNEVGELRQERPITLGDLLTPDWPLPTRFPEGRRLIRGFHLDRFSFLLEAREEQLHVLASLRPGL